MNNADEIYNLKRMFFGYTTTDSINALKRQFEANKKTDSTLMMVYSKDLERVLTLIDKIKVVEVGSEISLADSHAFPTEDIEAYIREDAGRKIAHFLTDHHMMLESVDDDITDLTRKYRFVVCVSEPVLRS